MNTVSIVTLALSALYLLISYFRFGMTTSISATFYEWMKRDYSAAFMWFCLIVCLGAWLQSIYDYKHDTKALLMLAGFLIGCVGIAATYKDKKVSTWHYVFAALSIALGFAALSVEYWGTWRAWVPISIFIAATVLTKWLWPKYLTTMVEVYALTLIFSFL